MWLKCVVCAGVRLGVSDGGVVVVRWPRRWRCMKRMHERDAQESPVRGRGARARRAGSECPAV